MNRRVSHWKMKIPSPQSYPLRENMHAPRATTMVGKRKREGLGAVADPIDGCSSSGGEDLQEIFRRHFEAQFQPLPQSKSTLIAKPTTEHEQPEGDESGWEGISNDQDDIDIEIVEYTASTAAVKAALTKEELKDFMVASHCYLNVTSTSNNTPS